MINGADTVPDGTGGRTLIDRAQPYYDDCSTRDAASLSGRNIGDNLNAAGLSWGWFQGGFRPSTSFATATGGAQPTSTFIPNQFKGKFAVKPASDQGLCNTVHPVGVAVGGIGGTGAGAKVPQFDKANHQYDMSDFGARSLARSPTSIYRRTTCPQSASSRRPGIRTGTPTIPTRSTSSSSLPTRSTRCSTRWTGQAPR